MNSLELHNNIVFYLFIILLGVNWILVSILINYIYYNSIISNKISNKYLNHGTLIELIWTITPALVLILIAFPSFKLLYFVDDVTDPDLSITVEGYQWHWCYQYLDFLNPENGLIDFDSFSMMPDENNNITLMEITDIRPVHTCDWEILYNKIRPLDNVGERYTFEEWKWIRLSPESRAVDSRRSSRLAGANYRAVDVQLHLIENNSLGI
jgi:heme/copper-type cytochrome/quinol oxidase subunit 2